MNLFQTFQTDAHLLRVPRNVWFAGDFPEVRESAQMRPPPAKHNKQPKVAIPVICFPH